MHIAMLILLAAISSSALGIELSYGGLDRDDHSGVEMLIVKGVIEKGDYERLIEFARADPRRFQKSAIVLASEGGNLIEAIKIGTLFKESYRNVYAFGDYGVCASACFLIYVAAVERSFYPGALGIHRPYFGDEYSHSAKLSESKDQYQRTFEVVRKYLEENDVPRYLIEKMFSMASNEVYWLTDEDSIALGKRAAWWEQVLIDKCGLDKSLERDFRRASPSANKTLQKLGEIYTCASDISYEIQVENISKLLGVSPQKCGSNSDQLCLPSLQQRLVK